MKWRIYKALAGNWVVTGQVWVLEYKQVQTFQPFTDFEAARRYVAYEITLPAGRIVS